MIATALPADWGFRRWRGITWLASSRASC